MKADKLIQQIREDLQTIDDQIRNHIYLQGLHAKTVPVTALRAFPGHQFHIVTSDLRSMAAMVQRTGGTPYRDFFNGMLQGELAALEGIKRMGYTLGMTDADLHAYRPTAEGFAYGAYMAWQAAQTSVAEFICGLLMNFAAWGHNCGQMSQALQARYGFTLADTQFLDSFANLPSFEEVALAIIQEGLDQGVYADDIHQAAAMFQAYEQMFWNSMAKIAGLM